VSARPTLPNTRSTSGNCISTLSVCCNSREALSADRPGSAEGMYSRSPSMSGGMNSLPICVSGTIVATISSADAVKVVFGCRSAKSSSGR